MINGLHIVIPSSRLPWLLDSQITSFDTMWKAPQTLLMLISIAMRFAHEGREGKSIGTCFIISSRGRCGALHLAAHSQPLRWLSRKHTQHLPRRLHGDPARTERLRWGIPRQSQRSKSDPPLPSSPLRVVSMVWNQARGRRHHSACALTSHTHAIAVVLSRSSGEITVYQAGRELLHFT